MYQLNIVKDGKIVASSIAFEKPSSDDEATLLALYPEGHYLDICRLPEDYDVEFVTEDSLD